MPELPSTFIRDYISLKRNLLLTGGLSDDQSQQIISNDRQIAQLISGVSKNRASNNDQDIEIVNLTNQIVALTAVVDGLILTVKDDRQLIAKLLSATSKNRADIADLP